jgi:hypothetical protein
VNVSPEEDHFSLVLLLCLPVEGEVQQPNCGVHTKKIRKNHLKYIYRISGRAVETPEGVFKWKITSVGI